MRYIFRYLKHYPKEWFIIVISAIATSASILGMPTMLAAMIDKAILVQKMDQAWPYAWGMLGFTILGFLSRAFRGYMVSRIVTGMTMDIRNDVYTKMLKLSHHEFQEFGVPSLTNRITNDAFIILQFTEMLLKQGMMGPFMLIFSWTMILRTAPSLGVKILPAVFFIGIVVYFIAKFSRPLSEKQQKLLDRLNRILRESITGLRVIRAFNRQEFQSNRFTKVNKGYRQTSSSLFKLMAASPSIFSFILNVAIVFLVYLGAQMIQEGTLQVGTLTAFIEYIFHGLFSLMIFSNIFMMYPRAIVSASRLEEVDLSPITVENPQHPVHEKCARGTVEFDNVSFTYPDSDKAVLENISFKSKPGETTAIIGSTGSGKSSIVKLIPRFFDVTKGQVLVNGVDVRDYDLENLRSKIGYTPQSALLFKGRIADNLRYGKYDADARDMEMATSIAQAQDFIHDLDGGYDAMLSEKGSNLSGGQKQRLSIARSIINKREIYIFDDSFSALDYKTDAKVRAALKEATQEATTIIVAQRVGTIMHADQIIVLDKGKISAIGKHKDLLKQSKVYYDIAASQLSEEELNHEF
ncbi:ABC transporter ATP-binding protein [Facklamia sp. 7083-14-GEN3]|uniref:ABC transporter ATP-binding protein n=1 Tax=Facklamia sp. 7083-14-GEN3 TaxID=2973478 RepID=UPI00215C6E16|nr:ABC transporter ATP-binding protein [Facklamia sp. 7083-14-GEN3]MCR8969120.1 ABC transporter ATP-binding protein/permease [Facklamia sp. 7083-14-GEN3]